MAPHKHDALCQYLHTKLQQFGEANPLRMSGSSSQQSQSQSQSQQQQQHQQSHNLNPQSTHFIPGQAWTASSAHTASRTAPQQPLTTSTAQNTATRPPATATTTSSALHSWANFKIHIEEDDKEVVRKAQEGLEKLGGRAFRPEIRETYRDRRGGREVTIREKRGGAQSHSRDGDEEWEAGSDGGVKLE